MAFSEDPVYVSLDQKFDKVLADMKPYVLKLPHKTDRQKCAIWIKKLCEPVTGITGRKNRNAYAQLMLHMLKRGVLEGPFTSKPQDGELPTLPPYMSIYFDEPSSSPDTDDKVPDWVNGELTSSVGSSLFRSNIGNPAASSTWKSLPSPISPQKSRRRAYTSIGIDLDRDPGYTSPSRGLEKPQPGPYGSDEELAQPSPPGYETGGVTNLFGTTGGTTFFDDHTKDYGKENIQMKTKMLEARFHEEKLKLQQRHDVAVQKILDRKNTEIEELKANYRAKAKELEDTITKLERKIQSVVRDSQNVRETKDKQIAELRKMVEDTTEKRKSDFERKMAAMIKIYLPWNFQMNRTNCCWIAAPELVNNRAGLQTVSKKLLPGQQVKGQYSLLKELLHLQFICLHKEITSTLRSKGQRSRLFYDLKLDNSLVLLKNKLNPILYLQHSKIHVWIGKDICLRFLKNRKQKLLAYQKHFLDIRTSISPSSPLRQSGDESLHYIGSCGAICTICLSKVKRDGRRRRDSFHLTSTSFHGSVITRLSNNINDYDITRKLRKLCRIVKKFEDNLNRFLELHKKAYNHHLESIITGDKNQGAVFRALPVYR
ncbi:centrosomal protein CEP112, partial [Mytilus galloprovincialis]